MIFIGLRVLASDYPVDDFLNDHGVQASSVWHKGELRRMGLIHEDSGYSIEFEDAESWVTALPSVQTFLEREKHVLEAAAKQFDVEMTLDIGVTVGEENSYAPSLSFPSEFLALLGALGITLNISAYPTAE